MNGSRFVSQVVDTLGVFLVPLFAHEGEKSVSNTADSHFKSV